MRQRQYTRLGAVARHQQPAGAALLDRMETVAGCRLGAKIQEGIGGPQHDLTNARALLEHGFARRDIYPERAAGKLPNDVLSRYLIPEQGRNAQHALSPNHPDFDAGPVRHGR